MSHAQSKILTLGLIGALATFSAACPKKTADLELDMAEDAIAKARAKKANDCATETFKAAETAILEARKLSKEGEVDAAKKKAAEAQSLAEQASASVTEDCGKDKEGEDGPDVSVSSTDDAAMKMNLDDVMETVYFDYNDATIREDSKAMLSRVASVMAAKQKSKLEIEGHCDVRGSTEYNLHLGERRARAVEKYLITQGVKPEQIDIISYGEERPIDLGTSEAAHQKNRRAELKKQ